MEDREQENFFASDSLKGILDKDDLIQNTIEEQAKSGTETEVVGRFSKLSLADGTFALLTDRKMVKVLLQNPTTDFVHSFMDEIWILSPMNMKVEHKNGDFEVTLAITGRR